jgi:hypothetical protein
MGRKGPGCISPTVQQEAIARWAAYRGVEIAAWHVDEDESGGTQDWPGLQLPCASLNLKPDARLVDVNTCTAPPRGWSTDGSDWRCC